MEGAKSYDGEKAWSAIIHYLQVLGGVCPLSTPPGLEDHSLQVSIFIPLMKVSSGRV
jgi:hypothetical protein